MRSLRNACLCSIVVVGAFGEILHAAGARSANSPAATVAQVSEELMRSEAYTLYAKILVQIDLLANANTAYLPITVSTLRPGQILVDGQVPTARAREHIVQSARRITGLLVDGNIEVAAVRPDIPSDLSTESLETEIQSTISGFYPEYADRVRTTVKQGGIVELNGDVPSYEAKLNISRIVKSQQGCKSVVNLLHVPAEAESGLVAVTEDGQLRLDAAKLPIIPAAPVMTMSDAERDHPGFRGLSMPLADDAPARPAGEGRLVEDARAVISRDPKLSGFELELDAEAGGIIASGKVDKQSDVEYILDSLAEIPGVRKVVVKSRPISMQRTYPTTQKRERESKSESWVERLRESMPWVGDSDDPVRMSHGFRFRSNVQKALAKKCESRIEDLKVKAITRGLLIEGEVSSARDRAHVLKQIDNLVELNAVPLDIVLRIRE